TTRGDHDYSVTITEFHGIGSAVGRRTLSICNAVNAHRLDRPVARSAVRDSPGSTRLANGQGCSGCLDPPFPQGDFARGSVAAAGVCFFLLAAAGGGFVPASAVGVSADAALAPAGPALRSSSTQ